MFLFAKVDGQRSLDSMKLPVFSLLTGNFTAETSSLETASSSGESGANPISWIMVGADALNADMSLRPLSQVGADSRT